MKTTLLILACLALAGCDTTPTASTSVDLMMTPSSDAAAATLDAGGKSFGAACASDGECATGHCFMGGMMQFCSMPCTTATQATDCPAPPTSGTCNMRGYCKP